MVKVVERWTTTWSALGEQQAEGGGVGAAVGGGGRGMRVRGREEGVEFEQTHQEPSIELTETKARLAITPQLHTSSLN